MNKSVDLNRIYHPWNLWEDYKEGFYNNCSGKEKVNYMEKVLEMFNSEKLTKKYMNRVINEWKYSCEHNLTNESINKIAYIGQSAACLYAGVPNTVTMEAWSLLNIDTQERANKIAQECLNNWYKKQDRQVELCLNTD